MKKLLLTIVATVLMAGSISAQNVARECVLVEAFTGINCGYCPAAAGGIGEMVKQGLSIAPLAFHCSYYSPPTYATSETNGRGSFYNVSGYPTVVVDGLDRPAVGGMASQYMSSYYALKAAYDERINVTSPFTIDLTFDYHSGTKCQAKAVLNKVGECNGNDVRVFIALTESHIPQSWGGWSELNAVVRDIVTTPAGVKVVGDSQEVTALFDVLDYKKENCELVAWVQSTAGGHREVYQAVKISIGTEPAQYDLAIAKVDNVPTELCSGRIEPHFMIKNCGSEALTSAIFRITDDKDNELGTYEWEGYLSQKATANFVIPEFNLGDANYINISALEINGDNNIEDMYQFDNTYKYEVVAPHNVPGDGLLKIQLKTTEPENVSIDIVNMDKDEIVKTFTFSDASKLYKEEYNLPEYGCYRVIFKNSQGNGIGEGTCFWGIIDGNNKTVVSGKTTENVFEYELPIELSYGGEGVEDVAVENVNVYPNPAKSFVNVYALNLNRVTVYNSVGQVVYSEMTDSDIHNINVESWVNGLYYINLETKDGVKSSQKVIVNK